MTPLTVTAIVPMWNAAASIRAALESLLEQSEPPEEIVVVDDGSTDGGAEIVRELGIRCLEQPNRGAAAARNAGFAAARGDAIAFLDADDLALPGRLRLERRHLGEHPDVDGVFGWLRQRLADPALAERFVCPEQPQPAWCAGTMLLRRAAFERAGPFDERLRLGEFVDWLDRARARGLRFEMLDEVVLERRIHGENSTVVGRSRLADYAIVARRAIERRRGTRPR